MRPIFLKFYACLLFALLIVVPAQAQLSLPNPFKPNSGGIDKSVFVQKLEEELTREAGEAVGVGSPLLLDQHTAYPPAPEITDFHPQKLVISSREDELAPLPPGDYAVDVMAFCTQFSIHNPGQGQPYKLARVQGRLSDAISALIVRGMSQNISPQTINVDAWRIEAGLPLDKWPDQEKARIHALMPEYEKRLQGDSLQQFQKTYDGAAKTARMFRFSIPSLQELLSHSEAGKQVLTLLNARRALQDKTLSAERAPDMLYQPTGDGLPRQLPPYPDPSPSPWAEVHPGVFARFTDVTGNMGTNLLEFRIMPQATAAADSNAPHFLQASFVQSTSPIRKANITVATVLGYDALLGTGGILTTTGEVVAAGVGGVVAEPVIVVGAGLFITYELGRYGAQALILMSQRHGDGSGSGKRSSPGNMQRQVEKGQAPKSVDRVDQASGPLGKNHIEFKDGNALNEDGTWRHGGRDLTNTEKEWITQNGWSLPK